MTQPARPKQITVAQPERSKAAVIAKRCVQLFFIAVVLPRYGFYRINQLLWGADRAFLAASEALSRIPGMRGVYTRQAFYRLTLDLSDWDAYFGFGSLFSMTAARVGERAYIGRYCSIGFADIGPGAILADGVTLLSGGHEHATSGELPQASTQLYSQVLIGEGAWIGANSVVMANVGARCIVGAGAVVTHDLPADCVAAGVPARVLRTMPTG